MTNLPTPTVKWSDMDADMQAFATLTAQEALERCHSEKDMASYMRKEFERKHQPTWHCFVGRNFGSYVTHEVNHYIYFYIGQIAFLIFKSG